MSAQAKRLDRGGRIDRATPVNFTFNGKTYQGCAGDTVASALLANGVHLLARSWKYHRPRGVIAAGAEEPNALLQLETGAYAVPNARATQIELYEDLKASSVNAWPSVEFDAMAINGWFARMIPAGFYYKTFMWPKSFWTKHYEHYIRKAAGFGVAPVDHDPNRYEKTNAHCDVLVVGAGPAGLAAALAAGRSGARVILADEQAEMGGSLLASTQTIDGQPAAEWVSAALAELATLPEVRVLPRATVYGYLDHNFLTIAERLNDHLPLRARSANRERLWRVRAKRVVLATGAHERPLVFGNNDLPGVMLAGAVSTYTNRYAVRLGDKAVVFTNNDSAYQSALDLHAAGVNVVAVVDPRSNPQGELPLAARAAGIRIIDASVVTEARGGKRISGVQVMGLTANGEVGGSAQALDCDLLAISGGWSPVIHLSSQSCAKAIWSDEKACFLPGKPVQAEVSVGACAGEFTLNAALAGGLAAGAQAAQLADFETGVPATPEVRDPLEQPMLALWRVPSPAKPGRGSKAFIDFQNDVGVSDIRLAAREGYQSIEHTKRYTALGFGTDQGKLGNINGMAVLAEALAQTLPETGTTTFRPNYTPVTFGTIAGRDLGELFDPIRKTALHGWHVEHGAKFEDVGQWKRPWYYPRPGEDMHAAVNRECLAARNGVALMDASTLGKVDIQGEDAAEFLNLIYTNAWKKLGIGMARYGLMLKEDGMIFDDGVTVRLAENHFVMTTTTGGAARVMTWLERWLQTEWPHMKVRLTSVTDHWATIAVVGPKSREVVSRVCPDIDFSKEAFPFMALREGTAAGVAARVVRISFSGELSYEINVNANAARQVWDAVMAAGAEFDITPYGTETMHVLRAEKGFIIVGQDTDGSVTPQDCGMGWAIKKTGDFIGRRSFSRPDTARSDRKQLVGLLTSDPNVVLPEGAQLVKNPNAPIPNPMEGHVSSSYWSANCGRSIAMALVKDGFKRMGETLHAPLGDGRVVSATICKPVFIDPEGAHQNV
ncbi:sarcosine oxidase subunit alpha family protein [Plasticicumulans acidivorans]|uniref:Heterotetrameric sarcosine oxidase alpha subunit n=1 Tax=Plasticicumulans acidivorans TaxID=886464 RepID=A0A317N426_9GAMM|nr:sarcosine oxidase subunit alpha family protein [Plasticicumulans acidivorans]PWV64917.1 heterotetrameric sarcosine oxidase alpha subunit [Plasticicumulans acidivorans]